MNIQDNSTNYVRKNEAIENDKKKKKTIIVVAAVLAVIIAIIFAIFWKKGYRTIKLLEIFKKVSFDRGDEKNVDVYENMSLKAGDTIRTGDDGSYARLVLDDDKYIYIEENSEVAFEMAGRKSSSRTTLHLNYGAIFNELNNKLTDKQSFDIKSPNSLMAVRGTKFRVSTYFGPDDILYTRVSVLEGKVECWLIYPDGTVSDESHIADVGSEVLIYYDEESGITDFARINDAGRYNSKEEGNYERSISFAQMPKQALAFLQMRAIELGGRFDAISSDELLEYVNLDDKLRDEPILERYGVSERQLVDEGLLNHIRGEENEAINEKYANAYRAANGSDSEENSPESEDNSLNNSTEVENSNSQVNNDTSEDSNNSENSSSENSQRSEAANERPLTPEEQLQQQLNEILNNPELLSQFMAQQAAAKAEQEALAARQAAEAQAAASSSSSSSNDSSSNDDDNHSSGSGSSSGGSTPSGGGTPGGAGGGGNSNLGPGGETPTYDPATGNPIYAGYDYHSNAAGDRLVKSDGSIGYTAIKDATGNITGWAIDPTSATNQPGGDPNPTGLIPNYDGDGKLTGYNDVIEPGDASTGTYGIKYEYSVSGNTLVRTSTIESSPGNSDYVIAGATKNYDLDTSDPQNPKWIERVG